MPSPSTRTYAWQPGRRVGRFVILGHLASGGMAEIFLARPADDPTRRHLTVLKRLNDEHTRDREFVAMFVDEARIGLQLDHPHVVRTFGLEKDAGSPYLALEYLSGESLQDIILASGAQGNPIPLPFAVRWVADAAGALHYAHHARNTDGKSLQLVHRDISPHNLFVGYRGLLKVVDFGIAKTTIKTTETQTGYVKGKLGYLSPEQVLQTTVDARTDVFALGIVLFEALTRSTFFGDQLSDGDIIDALSGDRPLERPAHRNPDVPPDLDHLCGQAMALHLEERLENAEVFQHELEDWLSTRHEDPTPEEMGAYVRELFPTRLARKEKMIQASLQADAQREPEAVDEVTSTDLDLSSLPELERLASEAKLPAPAALRATRDSAVARSDTRYERSSPPLPPQAQPQNRRSPWILGGALAVAMFAVTVGLGEVLSRPAPSEKQRAAHLRVVAPPNTDLRLDGSIFDPNAPVVPGTHHLVARWGSEVQTDEVELSPGEQRELRFVFRGGNP